jgi:ATP-dependent helicase/DNAse subunit B
MSIAISSIDEIDFFKRLTLSEFSYSRIDTYEMCPSKYFYSYIKREPRQFSAPAVLGNIIHSVLEDNISSSEPLKLDRFKG